MYKEKSIIDSNGYLITNVLIDENNNIVFSDVVLEEGQQFVEVFAKTQPINGHNQPYLKPQWTGTEWIETATQEELNLAYPVIEESKTELEILQENQALMQKAIDDLLLGGAL